MLALLHLGMVIAYVDRVNLSVALPEISKHFALSPAASGLLLSAFFWSYALLQLPAGWIVDRYGVRVPYLIGFLLWSVASASTALSTSLASLVVFRIVLGIGESVVVPSSMRYIAVHFEEKHRGFAAAVFQVGGKVGPAVGVPIALYLMLHLGWKPMFVIIGLASLLWLVPWMLLVEKDPKPEPARSSAASGGLRHWNTFAGSRVMWGISLGTFCYAYFLYFCVTWMPTFFVKQFGMSLQRMGWFTFISFAGMGGVAILAGWAADRFIDRGYNPVTVRKAFTIAGLVAASSQLLGIWTQSPGLSLAFAVVSISGLGLATGNYWALTQTLVPSHAIGRAIGIQNLWSNLAGIASPWFTGWVVGRTGSFDAPIKVIAFWLAVGIAAYMLLVREKYAQSLRRFAPAAGRS